MTALFHHDGAPDPPARLSGVVGSAVLLACSWTWCIGMFFPVYLIADFGWPGWVAFAVPNCLGAALVGVLWRKPGASHAFVRRHRSALLRFSETTILFHWFFILALFGGGMGIAPGPWMSLGTGCVAVAAVAGLAWEYSRCHTTGWKWITWGTLLVSLACAACSIIVNPTGLIGLPPAHGNDPPAHLWYVLPALALGFLVCPHMDLTFHRVRRELSEPGGTSAFIAAFAGFFPLLITYTLVYARVFLGGKLDVFVLVHIAAQAACTAGAHGRELREAYGRPIRRRGKWGVLAVAAFVTWTVGKALLESPDSASLGYRLFMSLYAIAFPAWLLCEATARDAGQRRLARLVAAVALGGAGVLFWKGYIEHEYPLLPMGVGAVLVGAGAAWALLARRKPRT